MGLQVDGATRRTLDETVLRDLAGRADELGLDLRVAELRSPGTLESPVAPTLAWSSASSDGGIAWVLNTGASRHRGQEASSADPSSLRNVIEQALEYLRRRPLVHAAGGIVLAETPLAWGIVLVAEPNVSQPGTVRWRLPKGLVDDGETAADAARREVREETGIDAEIICDAGTASWAYMYDGTEMVKEVEFFVLRALRRVSNVTVDEVVRGQALVSPQVAVAALYFDSEREVLGNVLNSRALEVEITQRTLTREE